MNNNSNTLLVASFATISALYGMYHYAYSSPDKSYETNKDELIKQIDTTMSKYIDKLERKIEALTSITTKTDAGTDTGASIGTCCEPEPEPEPKLDVNIGSSTKQPPGVVTGSTNEEDTEDYSNAMEHDNSYDSLPCINGNKLSNSIHKLWNWK